MYGVCNMYVILYFDPNSSSGQFKGAMKNKHLIIIEVIILHFMYFFLCLSVVILIELKE